MLFHIIIYIIKLNVVCAKVAVGFRCCATLAVYKRPVPALCTHGCRPQLHSIMRPRKMCLLGPELKRLTPQLTLRVAINKAAAVVCKMTLTVSSLPAVVDSINAALGSPACALGSMLQVRPVLSNIPPDSTSLVVWLIVIPGLV